MFKAISTRLLQHVIAQNGWANALLQPYAGKSVRFDIAHLHTAVVILENGNLAIAGDTNVPDASITIAPSLLLRLIAKDEAAKLQIKIEGDSDLATSLAKVLNHVRWDYEDDLSRMIGDVPAYKVSELGRHAAAALKEGSTNVADMLSEYWQEEKPMIAKKRHVEQFNAEVDTLRADVERLEKRLNKLSKQATLKTDSNLVTDSVQ